MSVRRTLFSDDFSVDGTLGEPNYTQVGSYGMPIATGGEVHTSNRDAAALYSGQLPADQWVEFEITQLFDAETNNNQFSMAHLVRTNTAANTGYAVLFRWDEIVVEDLDADTDLDRFAYTMQVGDVCRTEVIGNEFKVYVNDSEVFSHFFLNNSGGSCGMYYQKWTDIISRESGRFDNFAVGDWTVETGFTVTNVNGDNTIESGVDIYISGDRLDTVTGATLKGFGDHALTIESQTVSQIILTGVNLKTWNYPYGAGASIELTDGTQTTPTAVTVEVEPGYQYVVGASIDTTYGLAQAGGANGDQWRVPLIVESSGLILQDDTNFVLDAPVPEGTTFTFDLRTGGVWDYGDAQIGLNAPVGVPASWSGNIQVNPITVGVDFSGTVAPYALGDTPLTFAEILQQKPTEFVFRSDGSYSGYVPTADAFNVQYRVSNTLNQDGDDSNLISYSPEMPTISGATHQGVGTNGAQITVTTPSKVGTIYWIADREATEPTPEQITAGHNALDQSADMSGHYQINRAGQQPWQHLNGGEPGVKYYYWMVQVN